VGVGALDPANTAGKGVTLPVGNYEWPFELMLPGDTAESIEGLREAHVTWKLKATVARGKLAYDLHAYKRLRIIRTLEPSALEFLHAMSVENIWPNKIEYSIVVPQKAVVFGSSIPLETRFSPLLKGLELGDITIRLMEVHDIIVNSPTGNPTREFRKEREVSMWAIPMSREEHWRDMIDDTGQEGWVMSTALDLPRKLGKCIQDVNVQGIKVRHKLKLVVALKNPDGHVSELRATLPVTIFISPNMPLDEEGNLVRQLPQGVTSESVAAVAPPSYNEHFLDQLYDELEPTGLHTPATQSGVSSPVSGHSRAGSTDNLAAMMHMTAVTPAALSSRLDIMSLEESNRNDSFTSLNAAASSYGGQSSAGTPYRLADSAPSSAPLTRQNSEERSSGSESPDHLVVPRLDELPSYKTAVKAPIKPLTSIPGFSLPDYYTATGGSPSAPGSPNADHSGIDPMTRVTFAAPRVVAPLVQEPPPSPRRRSVLSGRRRQFSLSQGWFHGDGDEHRRLQIIQSRERVV
jgi:arrestin-related trafficking adapter 4/5/7